MTLFAACAALATLLCSLVAGFLFAFAAVVMPGLATLDDAGFIRGFRAIDGVIQRNQPVFLLVWVGSIPAVLATALLGLRDLADPGRTLAVAAALLYIGGVQLPTATINVPLNNALQRVTPEAMDEAARKAARDAFERRWTRWNAIRTLFAVLTSVMLALLLLRL